MEINIRILSWYSKKDNVYRSVCLENYIVSEADTEIELKKKIIESQQCFFGNMTVEEISDKRNYRQAPVKYILAWNVLRVLNHLSQIRRYTVSVNPITHSLQFA